MDLNINDTAPNFTLLNDQEQQITLTNLTSKYKILYFYPKDNTPGCTKQACSYSDDMKLFNELDATIIGISKDPIKSHLKFREKFNLQQHLLSDPELEVLNLYGVWQEKKLYGKTHMGVVRSTFILDQDNKIIYIDRKVKAANDSQVVYNFIKEYEEQQ